MVERFDIEDDAGTQDGYLEVSVRVSPEARKLLMGAFNYPDYEQAARVVAQLAFEEWVNWIEGDGRYSGMTDQEIDRVINLYAGLMPDVEPDVIFLYNRLNIPYGRAKYIVQAIINRQVHQLNHRAYNRLCQVFENAWAIFMKLGAEDRKLQQEIRFVMDPRSEKLLMTIIELMPIEVRPLSTFKKLPSPLPNTHEYSLTPRDFENVLKELREFRL